MTATYDPRIDWARDDAEAERPALETSVAIVHEVFGWRDAHTHASVTERDDCEAYGQAVLDQQTREELEAENAYERWLENDDWLTRVDVAPVEISFDLDN